MVKHDLYILPLSVIQGRVVKHLKEKNVPISEKYMYVVILV